MSTPAVRAELEITFKDGATPGIKAFEKTAEQAAGKMSAAAIDASTKSTVAAEQAAGKTSAATIAAANKSVSVAEQAANKTSAAVAATANKSVAVYENLSRAHATLGVRSERVIQDEIKQTQRAYASLAAAGFGSSGEQARAYDKTREKITQLTNEMGKLTSAQTKSATAAMAAQAKVAAAAEAANSRSSSSYAKFANAREMLGVRSEHAIQREIQQTEAAYNRLARSGTAGARDLARAQDASIAKVKALRREMGEVEKQSRINAGTVGGAVTAAAGAYMMTKPAVTKAIDYDHTVAGLTNTMFNDRDAAGRIAGKTEIKQAIDVALKVGGGTREQAAGTLSSLMGSGEFTKDQAYKLLGTIQKGSTATGADSGQLADIALAAKRMGVLPDQIDRVISKAIRAGELGGFELSDMAKHLPAALSSARSLGLSGMAGFERVLASMQASVLTAGTKDEAANNLINIFEKMNSADTAKDFQKQGIDLRGELVKGAGRGEDTITTFTALIDRVIAKDPKTKAVTVELDRLSKIAEDKKNPQREQALKQIQQIYGSGVIGKFLQDRQALQGFRAESQGNKSGLVANVREGLNKDNAAQELDASYAVMSDTASAKMQRLENAKLQGQDAMLTGAGGAIKPFMDGLVNTAAEFPILTASVSAATAALGLLAASAGVNAVLGGRNARAKVAPDLMAAPGAPVGTKSSRMMGKFGLTTAVAGAVLSTVGNEESAAVRYGSAALSGASLGAMFGPIGAAIGAAGGLAIQGVMDSLKPQEPKPSEAHVKIEMALPPGVNVKSQSVKSTGNASLDIATGNLWSGAPG